MRTKYLKYHYLQTYLIVSLLLLSVGFLPACKDAKQSTTTPTTGSKVSPKKVEIQTNEDGLKMHPTYPNIPLADRGITVVNKEGWDPKSMEFHIGYCITMMANLEGEYDTQVFCDCFLSKIQYYYEPIYFKEAYTDQSTWNKFCLDESQL